MARVGGHLFIINGDLTKVACDALLVPTDNNFRVEAPWRALVRGHKIPEKWGSKRVIALPASDKEPQVWLGNVGQLGDGSDFSVFAPTVESFVVQAADKLRSAKHKRIYDWPKPRLALNVVGSGLGGGSAKKGNLIRGLIEKLTTLADEIDVDIILVTYGPKPYAAAQRARRRYVQKESRTWRFHPKANPDLIREAHRLAEEAIERHLVLFIGAGVSAGAGVPAWKELLEVLAAETEFDDETRAQLAEKDLRDQATLIESELARRGIRMRKMVSAALREYRRYSLTHGLLASLPSKEAVTTNFDNLFETAYKSRGRRLAVLPDNPRKTDGHWLLKLHGSVERPDEIILTRSDYLSMPRQYGALMGLVQGLLLMRRMVFVGYSLSDEDFHELIDEVRAARGDTDIGRGVALTLFSDPLDEKLWEKDLDIVPMVTSPRISVPVAARELELFLDLVGYLSTSSASFFLDSTYSDLSDSEAELRDALAQLAVKTAGSPVDSVGHLVEMFLRDHLGA